MNYSIGITTFQARFEKYFKPLLESIKTFRPNIEVIVCINGEHNQTFDSIYRKQILSFISEKDNVFPCMYTEFRSLSKLWNTCLINSSNENMLLLNDDLSISSPLFFDDFEQKAVAANESFKINGSWSHVFLQRKMVDDIGWFDERFLGIGEEDGDFEWRACKRNNKHTFKNIYIQGIINHVDAQNCLKNINKIYTKYSKFNTDFFWKTKYEISEDGDALGVSGKKIKCINKAPSQYQTEKFYWENKHKL